MYGVNLFVNSYKAADYLKNRIFQLIKCSTDLMLIIENVSVT